MSLFNPRTIERALKAKPLEATEGQTTAAGVWADKLASGKLQSEKETALYGAFRQRILHEVLGYSGVTDVSEDEAYTAAEHETVGSGSVEFALGEFTPDERKIVAPLELKDAHTDLDAPMPGRNKSPVDQAWEYATAVAGVRWVLVSNYLEIRLYSYAEGRGSHERFDLTKIDDSAEYVRLMLLLSADNLLGGRTEDLLQKSHTADKEISEQLYAEYRQLREVLIAYIQKECSELDDVEAVGIGQKILDRILFVAFAEDNGLLPARTVANAFEHSDPYNPKPVWDNFKGLFRGIDQGNENLSIPRYNGGLFEQDTRIDSIQLPDGICAGFKKLGEYDFQTEIGVTILGRIFEQSISDLERLLARARGDLEVAPKKTGATGRRKRDGIVYTPDYIARFIVERTLGTHLDEMFRTIMSQYAKGDPADYDSLQFAQGSQRGKKTWNERELKAWTDYRYNLQTLRVVDPACGSGVFLVMAFDFLKVEYDRVNKKMEELRGAPDLFDPDSEILSQNLYGVDVNAESIEITKLSLWLKTARRGKVLDSLDHTIRVGDSLIEDANFAYLEHGFNWHRAFPEVFADGGFDIVLGNPPYVRMERIKPMKPYLERRFEVVSDRADLYCYFYERGLRLLKLGGRLGYISSSTFFKTGSGKPLRKYLLKNATLETVTDFGDLQVFEGVTTYPAIVTMRRKKNVADNELRFWKLNKLPDENFSAAFEERAEPYLQASLSEENWELESPALNALRKKIRAGRPTLNEVYGPPLYGIKTGLNEAFVINRTTRDRLIAEDPKSEGLLKPWLEGKDFKRWRAEPRDLWIIYIPKGKIDIEQYPAIKAHLKPFRERLEKRATQQEWFELQQAQLAYTPALEGLKISYPHFNSERRFHFERNASYSNDKSYLIPTDDSALLGLLNSNIAWFFLTSLSPAVRGGFHELRVQYVERLPIPESLPKHKRLSTLAETCQAAAEGRYGRQEAVRRRIPDLCPLENEQVKREVNGTLKLTTKLKEWWTIPDFAAFRAEVKKAFKADIPLAERSDWEDWLKKEKAEIDRLSAEINRSEDEINKIVYRLFDLTEDEIKLLEANI